MQRRTLMFSAAAAAAMSFGMAGQLIAQETYPQHTITIVVPSAAGGGTDIAARRTAELMGKFLGQSVIVENRPGAGTVAGSRHVVAAKPDGYTVLAQSSALTLLPHAFKEVGFSPLEDLVPIGVMMYQTNVFSVGRGSQFKTIGELVDYAKAHPDELTFGTGGQASPISYTVEMLKLAAGIQLTPVQYKGAGDTFPDVIAGRVTLVSSGYAGQAGFFPGGELRPLAVSSAKRLNALPDVPTLKEQGIDMQTDVWLGLLVPKGTPDPIVQKLSGALKSALEDPANSERIISEGGDPRFLTPAEFKDELAREATEFDKLATAIGMVAQ